jgi:hypothetical protein
MEQSTEILIIILSVTLTVFLIVAIVFIIALIKLIGYLRLIAGKAEHVVDNVETASALFKNAAGPMAAGKFLSNIIDLVSKKRKG